MLGIWNRDEWMKRDLAKSFYGQVEHGSPISGLDFSSLMKDYFSLYFNEYYNGLYVHHMSVVSLVFLLLLCCLCICFIIVAMYDSHHVFTCKGMNNVSMT